MNAKSKPREPRLDAMSLLKKADLLYLLGDWARAKESADEAIAAKPDLAAAYERRAQCLRNLGELDAAIADYDRTIELDPHNGSAWMLRGACKAERASGQADHAKALAMLLEAHPDYRRAAELEPESELTGLALLELEICLGKYLEAVGTTGEWWDRIRRPSNKMVCAWLGAIAMILAGRPERRWAHLREHLETERRDLDSGDWCLAEMEHHIKSLENKPGVDLAKVKVIHELFLSNFPDGPTRRGKNAGD